MVRLLSLRFFVGASFSMESTTEPPAPKKRKLAPRRGRHDESDKAAASNTSVSGVSSVAMDLKIKEAKKFAVMQAQQEACLGNYRSFDSPFGNYLVPVIPTLEDLLR